MTRIAAFLAVFLAASSAYADNLDNPTRTGIALKDGSNEKGNLSKSVGFKAYDYTASKDGIVRIELDTVLVNKSDNGGKAWRPYLRVLRSGGTAEAWSSNGNQVDTTTGKATMFFRMKSGDKMTVIASIALNNDRHGPAAEAAYTLTVQESK